MWGSSITTQNWIWVCPITKLADPFVNGSHVCVCYAAAGAFLFGKMTFLGFLRHVIVLLRSSYVPQALFSGKQWLTNGFGYICDVMTVPDTSSWSQCSKCVDDVVEIPMTTWGWLRRCRCEMTYFMTMWPSEVLYFVQMDAAGTESSRIANNNVENPFKNTKTKDTEIKLSMTKT